jgi:cysteine synthase A
MPIYDCVADTVGRTPLIRLARISRDVGATILGKMESRNPCSSVKDRIGVAMIRDAEASGTLTPGATIVEATSGNTGIALAFAAASIGYKLVITMPENMSRERVALLRMFGAEVVLTRGGLMASAVEKAEEIARNTPGAVMLGQFGNPANPEAHRSGTALEIWEDTGGQVDAFVAGVGTGGTITGVGQVLKDKRPEVKIVAVEPAESAVLSGGSSGAHRIDGVGAGFVVPLWRPEIADAIERVSTAEAEAMAARLAREEGLFGGTSTGANVLAALRTAERLPPDATVVTVLCDTGMKYLSRH